MRYFLAKNGSAIVDKIAAGGDTIKIDAAIAQYSLSHPTFAIVEVDQATFDTTPIDAVTILSIERSLAVAELSNSLPQDKFIRAVLLTILDEINVIRAALSLTPRTVAQMRTAIQNKINSGAAD